MGCQALPNQSADFKTTSGEEGGGGLFKQMHFNQSVHLLEQQDILTTFGDSQTLSLSRFPVSNNAF